MLTSTKVVKPCVTGEKVICLCITEPGAGSDVAHLSTSIVFLLIFFIYKKNHCFSFNLSSFTTIRFKLNVLLF